MQIKLGQMSFVQFTSSEDFFTCAEPLSSPENSSFQSLKGRWRALLKFFEKLAIVPLAFVCKLIKTGFSILGLALSLALLVLTLCAVPGLRALFVRRIASLAIDLADWVFWPVSVIFCLGRLALAATVHPALYFNS